MECLRTLAMLVSIGFKTNWLKEKNCILGNIIRYLIIRSPPPLCISSAPHCSNLVVNLVV